MPQVTLRYTFRIKTESRTFEHEAEFGPVSVVGDSIDAFWPAVEPSTVIGVEQEPGRIVVILEEWDPDAIEDRAVDWDNPITSHDLRDLADGGWQEP